MCTLLARHWGDDLGESYAKIWYILTFKGYEFFVLHTPQGSYKLPLFLVRQVGYRVMTQASAPPLQRPEQQQSPAQRLISIT
jgi:hypothetical protein